MAQSGVRVLIADDQPIFRAGLRALLEAGPTFAVAAETGKAGDAAALARECRPDVVLLGLSTPGSAWLEPLRALTAARLQVHIVVLAGRVEPGDLTAMLRLGVDGVLPRTATAEVLYKCLGTVMVGQHWVGRDAVSDLLLELRRVNGDAGHERARIALTSRERQVVAALVRGSTNREVAQEIGVSEQTVKNHLSHIFEKLGMSNRLELALYAKDHRLLDVEHGVF